MFDFSLLPQWYIYLVTGVFGAIMGSFLNVIAYRMHTGVSINGRSRCFSCATTLGWYELIPFVSYLAQRGRCRTCSAHIPWRDFWVECITALVFVGIVAHSSTWWLTGLLLVLASLLVVVVIYDLVHLIIPNELVLAIAILGLVPLGVSLITTADYWLLVQATISCLVAASVYFSLWYISGGRWIGFGDVKLAAALGVWITPLSAISLVIFSFWVGAVVGILLLLPAACTRLVNRFYPRRETTTVVQSYTMKSEIPFAPFIVVAFGIVYFYDITALDLITQLLDIVI